MTIDRTTLTRLATGYVAMGVVAAPVLVSVGDGARAVIAAAMMLALVPAGLIAARIHGFPRLFTLGLIAVGLLYLAEGVAAELVTTDSILSVADTVDLIATGVVIALATFLVHRQRGGLRRGDVLDASIIGVGAWLVAWIVFVQPFTEQSGQSILGLTLNALYLPSTIVLIVLAAVMVFGNTQARTSTMLAAVGLMFNVVGDLVYALDDVRSLGDWSYPTADALYVLSVAFCGAAFVHPTAPTLIGEAPTPREVALPGRLAALSTALIAPVLLSTHYESLTAVDRYVRSASALVLLGLVGFRLYSATKAQIDLQSELSTAARTDELTNLPNKVALFEHADAVINDRWRTETTPAMYLFDLDAFKNINDSLSHRVGDEVLCVLARRLSAAAAAIGATATRVSADEFVVFDPSPTSTTDAFENASAIHLAFQQELSTTAGSLHVKASCGVAVATVGTPTPALELFRRADIAMYRAKSEGRNRLVLYEPAMQGVVSQRMSIENALHGALERNELEMFHQPIIDIATGRVGGLEALIRWRRSDGTLLGPDEFIPVAEETGMIDEIGAWAIFSAVSQLRRWIDEGVVPAETTISVNVSPHQLTDPRFAGVVRDAIGRAGLPPHLLWLEVTESMMINNPELARAVLDEVRTSGVRIALDDFGTGYSSLSLLRRFPIQRIKIDRGFVNSLVESVNDRTLVRTIIGLGESMGIDVVAEGVESVLQLRMLHELGCAKAQGYLIAHPAPAENMRSTINALDDLARWPDFAQLIGDSPFEGDTRH